MQDDGKCGEMLKKDVFYKEMCEKVDPVWEDPAFVDIGNYFFVILLSTMLPLCPSGLGTMDSFDTYFNKTKAFFPVSSEKKNRGK